MQRRAAAIYVAFFVIVGAASFSLAATANEPTVSFDNPEHQLSQNDTFTVNGQEYTVSELGAQMEGGGHGSAPTLSRSGTVTWTNESAVHTETWENNTTVTVGDEEARVVIPNESDPSSFTLREEINRTQILQSDSNADNETITRNGEQYVVVTEDGSQRLVPAEEYFPEPEGTSYQEGDSVDYNGNETTFTNVSQSEVTLEWTAPQENTVALEDRANVTLGGEQYLAFFPNNETVILTQNYESYQQQTQSIDTYDRHTDGLWAITTMSFGTAVLLLGMAYLPSRY